MFEPLAVNVAVVRSGAWAVNVMVASTLTPDCTAALNDASCSRMMGGPAGRPARAGQMISRTSPVALVARTTPGSAGTGTVRGPNVSVPPFAVTDPPPESVTVPVPEMTCTAGEALAVHGPSVLIVPAV